MARTSVWIVLSLSVVLAAAQGAGAEPSFHRSSPSDEIPGISTIRSVIERVAGAVVVTDSEGSAERRKESDWKRDARRHAPNLDEDAEVVKGDYVVEAGDVHRGDLVVRGDLDIFGEVRGDVVAFGDITLGPEAFVRGDVVALGGDVVRKEGSEIRGDVVEVHTRPIPPFFRIRHVKRERSERDIGDLFPRRADGRVLFRYDDPTADEVYLVGDFNDWDEETDPMYEEDGLWSLSIPLEKGRYEYMFVVDGEWVSDPSNPETVRDAERDLRYSVVRVDRRGWVQQPSRRKTVRVTTHESEFDLSARYNRVDGLYLAGEIDLHRVSSHVPRVRGEWGYAFEREAWLGEIEVDQPLIGCRNGLSAGFNYHQNTYAHDFDDQIIGDSENTLAAFLLKEDFRDYYERMGASVFANLRAGSHVHLRVEYRNDDYTSLPKTTNWALFGKDKCFRCNPSLHDSLPYCDLHRNLACYARGTCEPAGLDLGRMRSLWAAYTLDFRNDPDYPTHGWYLRLGGERAGDNLGGDYEFTKYWVDLRKYTRLAPRSYVDLRLYAGSSDSDLTLPPQKEYYVGGIGTLTARRHKEFRGNRVMLGSLEYRVAIANDLQGAFFVDSGDAWYDGERAYDLKTDVGLALQDADSDLRVSYTKKSEDLSADGVWMLRLNRTF